MKQVEYFRWWLPPEPWQGPKAKPHLSRWTMSREDAARYAGATPKLDTRVVRFLPETGDEVAANDRANSMSHLNSGSPGFAVRKLLKLPKIVLPRHLWHLDVIVWKSKNPRNPRAEGI